MKKLGFSTLLCLIFALSQILVACGDDKEGPAAAGADLKFASETRTLEFAAEGGESIVKFTAGQRWVANVQGANWISFGNNGVQVGDVELTVKVAANKTTEARTGKFVVSAGSTKAEFTVNQAAGTAQEDPKPDVTDKIDPATIPNYDKFFPNFEHGRGILNPNSKFSFARYAESEHFFVFWDKYFGEDPNGDTVDPNQRVDVKDLLEKAEHFFDTNINKLGMAVLGQGKSVLDKYKMQIYILDPTPEDWVATGSGYDNMIGALWITPATCHPVGSTIAHEIGHSFQYQTYADRVQMQGVADNEHSGFRYGYDTNGEGGCPYWEQCAQWQSYQDYPNEQFESYNFTEWVNNHHRHFHHEWMRYASYWLQTYWVEKRGIEAYGRIWRDSAYPEDAIEAYTKIYNGGDYSLTREELAEYAMKMATYDMASLPSMRVNYIDQYKCKLLKNADGYYQPTLDNCPGATGFNVIPLNVPEGGGKVKVNFKGLESGAPLLADDPGKYRDGDGKDAGTTRTYNACSSLGWRYGFVAFDGSKSSYSAVGKDKEGVLEYTVPAGTQKLFLVVQGSPERYIRHGWDDDETDDPMFPYAIKFENTGLLGVFDIDDTAQPKDIAVTYNFNVRDAAAYEQGSINVASKDICQAFVLDPSVFTSKIATVGTEPAEGNIVLVNTEKDGTIKLGSSANNGIWLDADGNVGAWSGGYIYYEITDATLKYGTHPDNIVPGTTYQMRPTLIYTKGGKQYKAVITINIKA